MTGPNRQALLKSRLMRKWNIAALDELDDDTLVDLLRTSRRHYNWQNARRIEFALRHRGSRTESV